jgi:AAA domain
MVQVETEAYQKILISNYMAVIKTDKNDKRLAALESRRFDPNKEYIQDKTYLEIGGHIVGTSGNVVTVIGPPKIGKSTFVAAMSASLLAGHSIFGMQLMRHKGKETICVFDTEQSGYDISKHLSWIKKLSKVNKTIGLDIFTQKEIFYDEIILDIICYLDNTPSCGIIVIDGLIDMVASMNDDREAQILMRKLLIWGKKYDILIICILHTGKGKELNSLGHLGSFCDRKSQSVLLVEKNEDNTRSLKCKFTRASPEIFDDVIIKYNKETKAFYCVSDIEKLKLLPDPAKAGGAKASKK